MVRRNLTWEDATFRGLFGLVLVIGFMDSLIVLDGAARAWAASAFGALATVMIATSFTGFCPLYRAFGRKGVPVTKGWREKE